jgi:hypothetical protein
MWRGRRQLSEVEKVWVIYLNPDAAGLAHSCSDWVYDVLLDGQEMSLQREASMERYLAVRSSHFQPSPPAE